MRRINFYLAAMLMAMMSSMMLTSCSKEEETEKVDDGIYAVDFVPLDLVMYVVDEQGNNLLDQPNSPIVMEEVSMWYCDKSYPLDTIYRPEVFTSKLNFGLKGYTTTTRVIAAVQIGLAQLKDKDGKSCIYFGEIPGDPQKEPRDLRLHIGDDVYFISILRNGWRPKADGFETQEYKVDGVPFNDLKHIKIVYPQKK